MLAIIISTTILSALLIVSSLLIINQLRASKTAITPVLDSQQRQEQHLIRLDERLNHLEKSKDQLQQLLNQQQKAQHEQRTQFDQHQINSLKMLQDSLSKGMQETRQQITSTLKQHTDSLGQRVNQLTEQTGKQLKEISGQVDKQLAQGFEKTTATFADVMKRLTIIDQAQQKITELSANVVSLQDILADKRSRGAFGEVQLAALIRNVLPEKSFSLQHTLSNKTRVDCLLFLPQPTGNTAVDAKFPLESYRKLMNLSVGSTERKLVEKQFQQDIRKHVDDIASKYIIKGETSDGAVMFIPAEAVFAEIHAHHPDIVEYAQRKRVWLTSPTTMMAILTTARAVLKDEATREQVHIIQKHLVDLGKDFSRFQKRMDNLAKHISQAQQDVDDVHISSKKITSRFEKIEQVEMKTQANKKESQGSLAIDG